MISQGWGKKWSVNNFVYFILVFIIINSVNFVAKFSFINKQFRYYRIST